MDEPSTLPVAAAAAYLCAMKRFEENDYSRLRRFDLIPDSGRAGFEVTEAGENCGRFASAEEAYTFMLENEGRVRLLWYRTVIGGQASPHDFSGRLGQDHAGRILKETMGASAGKWQSFPSAFNPKTGRSSTMMGIHDSRDAAVAWIERKFTETMSGRFETLG